MFKFIIGWFVLVALVLGGVIYVAAHFISKFW